MRLTRIILLFFCLMLFSSPLIKSERRQTTRKNLTIRPDSLPSVGEHWVVPGIGFTPVKFYGYEKKQSADKETLFIQNATDSAFSVIRFTIRYLDTSNRELHCRPVEHRIELPANGTRRIDFRSWDVQKSYYYVDGPAPRRTVATPYKVEITLDSLLCN